MEILLRAVGSRFGAQFGVIRGLVLLLAIALPGCVTDTGDVEPLKADAKQAMAQGRPADALRSLRLATEFAPEDAEAFFLLGGLELKQGHLHEAEAALARAVEIDPRDPQMLTAYGHVLKQSERYADAETVLLYSLALRPGDPATLATLGEVYRLSDRPEQCAARYAQFVSLLEQRDPNTLDAREALAMRKARKYVEECGGAPAE